mgnify:CR=1 FL=1
MIYRNVFLVRPETGNVTHGNQLELTVGIRADMLALHIEVGLGSGLGQGATREACCMFERADQA